MSSFKFKITEYAWDEGTPRETPGIKLRNRTDGGFVFIPLTEVVSVSDALVDFIEQHESKEN